MNIKTKKFLILAVIAVIYRASLDAGDPYSFYPTRIYRMDESVFSRSEKLVEITPSRPLIVTDREGNKTLVTADGNAMVQIDTSGKKTFYIGGRKDHQIGQDSELERRWARDPGSARVRVENERGETLGYEEYGLGGKLVSEYDAQGNLIKSVEYDKYGKRPMFTVDELTLTKTIHDDLGRAVKEVDFAGNTIAEYTYDESGRIHSREDIYGNITYFDRSGSMSETYDVDGRLIMTYNYKVTADGYRVLDFVKDEESGIVTYYENDRQVRAVDAEGNLVTNYKWLGTRLIYSKDMNTDEITWFNNGKPAFATKNGEKSKEWFYERGRLVGMWNESDNQLILFAFGREESVLTLYSRPERQDVLELRRNHRINEQSRRR